MLLSAHPADRDALARLLADNELPTGDLGEPGQEFFEFHDSGDGLVGVGGRRSTTKRRCCARW